MTEADNKNYGTIEEQFGRIRECIVKTETIMDFPDNYYKLDISNNLNNPEEKSFYLAVNNNLVSLIKLRKDLFNCLDNEKGEENFVNFIFGFGQDNLDIFLNNEQIDAQDKFSALVTKYAIISQLPDEFRDARDKEMDLLYNHIEKVSKDYAKYIEDNGLTEDILENNLILSNSLTTITDNILSNKNKTEHNKDIKFTTDIYRNMPILAKDRIINYQGQPVFNRLVRIFLENPHKNDDIINLFRYTIQSDPSCIYKFSATYENINSEYKQIEESKDFSGNFICNFPNALNENGKIKCEEDRCKYNIFSDILYTLNYKELPEDVRGDVIKMLNCALESLSNHIKSLRDNGNIEELQKINYLLNCPIEVPSIQDPNTKDIVTPMDLINNLRKKGIINITEEQIEQFRNKFVYLQTVEEVKNSIEYKKAVAKKQKEEKMKETQIDLNADGYMERIFLSKEEKEEQKRLKDKEESIPLNEYRTMEEIFTPEVFEAAEAEVKKKEKELETEKENTKASIIYKIFNFFSKTFLKRDTKYRTNKEISIEKELCEKKAELSGLIFNSATKTTEKQIQTLNQNISKEQTIEQTKGVQVGNGKGY